MKYILITVGALLGSSPLSVFAFSNNAPATIELNVPIPTGGGASLYSAAGIGPYFQIFFAFTFGVLFTVAIVSIIWSGIRWITSAGDASVIKEQKNNIINGILGFTVALFSYYILYIINPDLTTFKGLNVNPVTGYVASCDWTTDPSCPYEKAPDEGKECDDKKQCVTGLCLDALDGVFRDDKGKCAAAVKPGETCEDNIVVHNGLDEDAPCPAGTMCKGMDRGLGTDPGKCLSSADGSPCWDESECDSGVCWDYADGVKDGVGKCVKGVPDLGICQDANVDHNALIAGATLGAGQSLGNPDAPCANPDSKCNIIDPTGLINQGTCAVWGWDGWLCSQDIDCKTADGYVCNKGFTPDQCKKRQSAGNPCDTDLACQPGLVCKSDIVSGGCLVGECKKCEQP